MARGGAGQSDRPAHARGVLRARRSGAGIRRFHRDDLRQFRRQLRFQARQAAVPRPGAGRGDAGGSESRRRRASTCSMPDAAPGCAARSSRRMRGGWSGSICRRGMLTQAEEQERLRRAGQRRIDRLSARLARRRSIVIVSADTLVYFGPLEDVVAACGGRAAARRTAHLHRGGVGATPDAARGISISPHGRYSHAREYVERVLVGCGPRVRRSCRRELRLEAGDPVAGLVVRATKPTSAGVNHA